MAGMLLALCNPRDFVDFVFVDPCENDDFFATFDIFFELVLKISFALEIKQSHTIMHLTYKFKVHFKCNVSAFKVQPPFIEFTESHSLVANRSRPSCPFPL